MVPEESLLVTLVKLVDRVPMLQAGNRGRGRPKAYTDKLFLKALVIMIEGTTSPLSLPTTGTYRIVIDPNGIYTGSVALTLTPTS